MNTLKYRDKLYWPIFFSLVDAEQLSDHPIGGRLNAGTTG
jgi:hypothetical protein